VLFHVGDECRFVLWVNRQKMRDLTLIDVLRRRAGDRGERLAFTYLEDGTAEAEQLTYGSLDERARAIATQLQSVSVPGDRALLLYPAGLEFLSGLFGCLYAGVIAIPAPPPEASRLKRTAPRLRAIAADAQATLVLTTSKIHALCEGSETPIFDGDAIRWMETDRVPADLADLWREPKIDASHLAYLQYTSGSTSTPKGVMIRHQNLSSHLANLQGICGYSADSVTVTWMPYFHDYGLVEGLLEPLFNATPCYVMSPFAFVKRPFSWLQALTRYRGTHSQAPNFAYDLCVRRIPPEQRGELDLRHWRSAGNAAEPINPRVLRAFHEAFRIVGFQWRASCPAYGLAEATLLVSSSRQSDEPSLIDLQGSALESHRVVETTGDPDGVRTVVGCGRIFESTKVAIVHPETLTRCAPDEVGEIWVSDRAVAQGYWQRPAETEATFRAHTADTGEGPFLRTGDLGFIKNDELFITGRIKDLVIIRGTNHYPQDIEWTVQAAHSALRPESGAAFAVMVDGEEKLVIAQEVEREHVPSLDVGEVFRAIRQAVGDEHELEIFAVVLLNRGSLPKTASGKIQRQACRTCYFDGGPNVLGSWVAPTRKHEQIPAWLVQRKPSRSSMPSPPTSPPLNGNPASALPSIAAETSGRKADDLIGWLRQYATERINSRLMDERRCIPPHIILDFGNRGVLGMQVPEFHEGLGLRYRDFLRVLEQVAAIDLNLAAVVFLNNTNGIRPILNYGRQELRDELLPLLARGRELAAFALSEPGAGSNVGGISSIAQPQPGGGWRLHGLKRWNQSSWAGVVSVFVRLVEPDGRLGGLTAFAVRQGTAGLRIGPEALTTGLRGSVQNSLYLHNVLVGSGNLLGEPGRGMVVADDALMVGRVCTAALGLGAMKRCAQLMVRYAERRSVATGRLLDNPVTRVKLSELTALVTAVEALLGQVAGLMDAGSAVPNEIAMALKVSASEAGVWAAGELMQLLGGRGYMENNIAPQLLRDARVLTVGEGPNETLSWYVGRSVSQTETIRRFLADSMGQPELASRLNDDVHQITEGYTRGNAPFSERSAAVSWACSLAGGVASDALLVAALQSAVNLCGSPRLTRALDWARLRYDATLSRALRAMAGESPILTPLETTAIVSSYVDAIGDIEQDSPGEEQALDPLLRLRPANTPGNLPAGLPGDLVLAADESSDRAPPSRPSPSQVARLSPQAKRELLEQTLRRRIAESQTHRP